MVLEVCVDNIQSALNAARGGSKRIELCSVLCLGGLTPSVGLLRVAKNLLPADCKIFVMIRPNAREDYVYSDHDIRVMEDDINAFRDNGADGFVFGCLNEEKNVDEEACKKLLRAATNYPCTFHRAFDVVNDPMESMVTIIRLGFSRILTSGQEKTAFLGKHLIRKLALKVKESGSDLIIMAGGGLCPENLKEVLETTGVLEFHGSATEVSTSDLKQKLHYLTDESVVRQLICISNSYRNKKQF